MKKLMHHWRELARDESGAVAIEYGLLAGLIAVGIVGGVTAVRDELIALFTLVTGALPG